MSFIMVLLVWGAAMGAWFLVSKYAKSSDIDKVKARLSGTTKAKAKKNAKDAAAAGASVVGQGVAPKNRFAQMLVEKWGVGPKLTTFLEQAGIDWPPARLVHVSLVCFIAGFAVAWLMLPVGKPLAFLVAFAAGGIPWLYAWGKRRSRLRRFEEIFPDALE